MVSFEELSERHERLKKRIHAMRFPIKSRAGRFAMGCVYFFTPLIGGYYIMRWSEGIRDRNLGVQREKLLAAQEKWAADGAPQVVRKDTPKPRKVEGPPAKEL
jgi:hypothetical protein